MIRLHTLLALVCSRKTFLPVLVNVKSFVHLYMLQPHLQTAPTPRVSYLQVDLCDAFTWSFPEFIPFCVSLYYYSSLKTFGVLPSAH